MRFARNSTRPHHRSRAAGSIAPRLCLGLGLGLALLVLLPACNIVGPLAYFVGGLPKIDAQYEIQPRPTVVFVDDRANVIDSNARLLRLELADVVTSELMEQDILTVETAISPRDAMGMALSRDRFSELLPIDAIGREVGAEQIIYIEMHAFRDTGDGTVPRPTGSCRVRVLDVTNRVRLFPPEDDQMPSRIVNAVIPPVDPGLLRSQSSRLKVHRALIESLGSSVAKLFYRHEARELGDRLKPR
ncbi:MAG: hypothetical protein GY715_17345 [Planctomycetes bacterium]|nr:hypothetical protein [Planctomycetota bacterium]